MNNGDKDPEPHNRKLFLVPSSEHFGGGGEEKPSTSIRKHSEKIWWSKKTGKVFLHNIIHKQIVGQIEFFTLGKATNAKEGKILIQNQLYSALKLSECYMSMMNESD